MASGGQRVLLVANSGGHLLQMLAIEGAFSDCERVWVTLDAADSQSLLAAEQVVLAHGPTNRSFLNLVRNLFLACRIMATIKPDVIVSTGAALAVPFFIVGRITRKRLVYIESFTRVQGLSLSGRMVYPLAHTFFIQWPRSGAPRRAQYAGSVL
jgi:beta-1,4-N-acetylglucosaminyltransferase